VVASTKTLAPKLRDTPRLVEAEFDVELVKQPCVKSSSPLVGTVTFLVITVFVPLVIWLVKRRRAPFAAGHAKEALNFQINILLIAVLAVVGRPYLEVWQPHSGGYWCCCPVPLQCLPVLLRRLGRRPE